MIHELTFTKYELSTYFQPQFFDRIVEATRELGKTSAQLALTIGNYVKQLCQICIAQAVKEFDEETEKSGEQFLKLYTGQWSALVSSTMSKKQRLSRMISQDLLPKSIDLVQLTSWLKEEVEQQTRRLTDYVKLVKLVIASLILFNSRRPMEIEEIKVDDFKKSLESQEEQEEIVDSLSPEEKVLANRRAIFHLECFAILEC